MKIVAGIKRVPTTEAEAEVVADTKSLEMTGYPCMAPFYDEIAVEKVIKAKKKLGVDITVLTIRRASMHALMLIGPTAGAAFGQDVISTERPGLLTPASLVSPGTLQLELGLPNAEFNRGSGVHTRLVNVPLLVRYGVSPGVEVRLRREMFNYFRDESGPDTETSRGFGDTELSGKFALTENTGFIPQASLVAGIDFPTGDDDFSAHQAAYKLSVGMGWNLSDGYTLDGFLGLSRSPVGDGDDATSGAIGFGLSHGFGNGWGTYVEVIALPGFENASSRAFAGTGVTYTVTNDEQLDLSGDFGLNSDSTDAIIGFGISWRL